VYFFNILAPLRGHYCQPFGGEGRTVTE